MAILRDKVQYSIHKAVSDHIKGHETGKVLEDAITLLNFLRWHLSWRQIGSSWQLLLNDRLLLTSDAWEEIEACIYGIVTIMSEWVDGFINELKDAPVPELDSSKSISEFRKNTANPERMFRILDELHMLNKILLQCTRYYFDSPPMISYLFERQLYEDKDKDAFATITRFYNEKISKENQLTSTLLDQMRQLRLLIRNQQFPEVIPHKMLPLLIATLIFLGPKLFWLQDIELFVEDGEWLQESEPWLDKGQWRIAEGKWSFWFGDQWYFIGNRSEFEAYVFGMVIGLLNLPDELFKQIIPTAQKLL